MTKKRFTFETVIGTGNLRGDPAFTLGFAGYLRDKEVDPRTINLVTIASCAGHSFVITREIPPGESEDMETLTETSYAKYGSICHGTHLYHDQSIVRNRRDVAFGVRAGLSARNMIHFCVATNPSPLRRHGLYCYLDLKVAIGELGLRVMYTKTAQVVLVEFCKDNHDCIEDRKAIRQQAVDTASRTNHGPVVPVLDCEEHLYQRPSPRTKAQHSTELVTVSSSSLSRSSLSTLPAEEGGVTLRSRHSVLGSDAGYSETIDGDYSDFGEAHGSTVAELTLASVW